MRSLGIKPESFPLLKPFTISRGSVTSVEVVTVIVGEGEHFGRGECRPYARYSETISSVSSEIERFRNAIESGCTREDLQMQMPAGAARNAIDCALWDLEAKRKGLAVWQLAELASPVPHATTYTISLDVPEKMAAEAAACGRPLLKLKLGAAGDIERLQSIREAVPSTRLIVDANEGWSFDFLCKYAEQIHELGVELIEQPLPAADDAVLSNYKGPVPICADESCHDVDDLERLAKGYRYINIKLDKTGGLSSAFELARAAQVQGFGIMLGCMMASSLSMAPAFLLADLAEYVDLDAPLLLASDREHAFQFDREMMLPPKPELWG